MLNKIVGTVITATFLAGVVVGILGEEKESEDGKNE